VERFTAFFGPATRQKATSRALDPDRKDFVKFDQRFTRPAEVDILLRDASKARDELGLTPEVDFKGLIKMMVKHDFDLADREKRALES
jgi:GDPmannose 4,6-dehydratase